MDANHLIEHDPVKCDVCMMLDNYETSLNNGEKIPDLPEVIGGHPWFMYVDPEVDLKSTEFISQTIDSEFKFMLKIMGSEEDAGDN